MFWLISAPKTQDYFGVLFDYNNVNSVDMFFDNLRASCMSYGEFCEAWSQTDGNYAGTVI